MSSLFLAKNYGRVAKGAVYRVSLLVSPFYSILVWLGGPAVTGIVIDLILKCTNLSPPIFEPATKFIETHIRLISIGTEAYLALLLLAWVGTTERRLRAAFHICKAADELKFGDLGFREVRPQETEAQESFYPRPFFGTYFPRNIVDWPEDSRDDEAEMAPRLGEDVLQQLLQQGHRIRRFCSRHRSEIGAGGFSSSGLGAKTGEVARSETEQSRA